MERSGLPFSSSFSCGATIATARLPQVQRVLAHDLGNPED